MPIKTKNLFVLILTGFCIFSDLICTAAAVEVPNNPVAAQLESIQQYQESGKYTEARKMYETLMQNASLLPEQKESVRRDFEKLNMQILFSRIETPESEFYTVVAGDSLYAIAKKFKTTIDLIKKSNALSKDTIYAGVKLKIMKGSFSVRIDKSDNALTLFLNEKFVKQYDVSTGKDNITPVGDFEIVNKLENPTWFHAGAVVPPESPENILGTRWLGFNYQGYGIHGTTDPDSIGKQVSAGCVRMRNQDAEELYAILPVGTKVMIKD